MVNDAASVDSRALLEQERADLRFQLEELGADAERGLSYDSNFADSSQVTAERGEAEAVATTLKETLDEVEHALVKLDADDGTYGICEKCGNPIAAARLEAMPSARYCIDCASKL